MIVLILSQCLGGDLSFIEGPVPGEDNKSHVIVPRPSVGIVYKLPASYMLTPSEINTLTVNLVLLGKSVRFDLTCYAYSSSGFDGLEAIVRNADLRTRPSLQAKISNYKFLKLCEFFARTHYVDIKTLGILPYNLEDILSKYSEDVLEDRSELPFLFSLLSFNLDTR